MNSAGDQIDNMNNQIARLKAAGGKPIVSFGGAAGQELALTCTNRASLAAAYKSVIDKYGVDRVDFDIEGSAIANRASNKVRAQAIADVQNAMAAAGKPLVVTYTLPVMPTGLTNDGVTLLSDSVANGMRIDVVNVMAMDYGTANYAMGQAAIDAATSTANQLATVYPSLSSSSRLAMVGITPMIGENDVANEVFTLSDAVKVNTWARANGIAMLAWWSVSRDQACPGNAATVSNSCSGTSNAAWAYANAFSH